ncbi:MAG: cellulase family glycosylhydrolase, partial [Thermoproteota archaeon]|nr:cellulase family glycosylhydrolase [Thermoproteota archaeon]
MSVLNLSKDSIKGMLVGVNFDAIKISAHQNREMISPPNNYIGDSFRIFVECGLNCVRIPFYWESFEKDPNGFIKELETISEEADKNGLMCIYDNHQWECSSFLGHGIGFPNSLLSIAFQRNPPNGDYWDPPIKIELKKFWSQWWDRKLANSENKDGWELQQDLLQIVIDKLDNKKSTLGFEILNEPQVFRSSDFKKVSNYHNFMVENLRYHTEKPLFFSYVFSNSIKAIDFPWRQSRTGPTTKINNKFIFDIHPYPPHYVVLLYYKLVSILMKNDMIFVGEFNAGIKKNVTVNSNQHLRYIKRFLDFSLYGATFWRWSYKPDNN